MTVVGWTYYVYSKYCAHIFNVKHYFGHSQCNYQAMFVDIANTKVQFHVVSPINFLLCSSMTASTAAVKNKPANPTSIKM